MRSEGVGTLLIKGPGDSSVRLRAAAHMQPRTQPLAQALPFSFRRALWGTGFQVPVMKTGTGWEGLQQTLKEVAYILLCCWCIKELLD
ncbi:lens epithelial cell protein LEP503 [Lynx canadensis]|uniref:lens epithelial cell protein LEP503 n=1 Tax=Lynx canadensis TaxID=61383 RepID=UPI0011B07348|nr:lens epithelial cell protein LEP503 [Lynx canadensis]XP_043425370.1 lens epithelial cell protein LEP503 [Prionailurus bengalensis]XP_046948910.1 lens epithelial cell protein LEP503 [Lynx rufus]